MTPWHLAAPGNEHSEQRALFAWATKAKREGFDAAWNEASYAVGVKVEQYAIPELDRMFAVPNGGLRDKITASKLKAEGVKAGVPDVFLPVVMRFPGGDVRFSGLFVELKRQTTGSGEQRRQKGSTSDIQEDWVAYLRRAGYGVAVAFGWIDAAKQIQSYIEEARKGTGQ